MHATSTKCLMKNVYLIFNPKQLGTNFGMTWRRQPHHIGYRPITAFLPEGEGHLHGELVVNFRSGAVLAQKQLKKTKQRIIIKVELITVSVESLALYI